MQISARNQLSGTIPSVVKGATTSHVTVEIASGQKVVSSITIKAVAELGLQREQRATVIIKASDVMIGID